MDSQATSILGIGALREPVLAEPAADAAAQERAVDVELRAQRLRVVAWYSTLLGICGLLWCAAYAVVALSGVEADRASLAATLFPSAVLSLAGWWAVYRCRRGQLRRATYANVAALTLTATANLVFIRNAEGSAVATYAVAFGMAALVIQGREWLWWGGIFAAAALLGSTAHALNVVAQFELPPGLAAGALIISATLGLSVPMALFWLFSRDLTASHQRAWELTREAAAANTRASERARQLQQRTEQLESKNAEMNDFLYVVSHDLRAPLINLDGFSRTLQDGVAALEEALPAPRPVRWPELKAEIDESLDFIVRSVAKMDFLVQRLLDLSRIDSRPYAAQSVDLGTLVAEVLDSFQYMIGHRRISVRVDPLPVVTGDPVRIQQVFSNLIDNAVKYMPAEGEAIIRVGCVQRDGTAQFFVRDSGVGIRPEDQGKIFRLFGRVGNRAVPGDGMGLTAVKKILEKQGGKIWVESALGRGSTFWFTLPRRAPEAQ